MSLQPNHAILWRQLALQTILYASLQVQAQQSQPVLGFFLIDSEPKSLEASVVAVNSHVTPPYTYDHNPVTTLVVDCPSAPSADNDACRAVGIYRAEFYHTKGSVWAGATTYQADNSTTSWRCELGEGWTANQTTTSTHRPGPSAECSKNITDSNGVSRSESTVFDDCYMEAHNLPLVITAGAAKIDPYEVAHYMTFPAEGSKEAESSELTSMGCPSTRQTLWIADPTTTNAGLSSIVSTAITSATVTPSGTGAAASHPVGGGANVTGSSRSDAVSHMHGERRGWSSSWILATSVSLYLLL